LWTNSVGSTSATFESALSHWPSSVITALGDAPRHGVEKEQNDLDESHGFSAVLASMRDGEHRC
jgi:hypothetical protein